MIELIVEDGTGLENANSYVTLEEVDEILPLFIDDVTAWDELDEEVKKIKVIRASKFFDTLLFWRSTLLEEDQGLLFPREEFEDAQGRTIGGITKVIKESVVQLIFESVVGELTTESDKLISEAFGGTTDTYASPKILAGSQVVQDIIKLLSRLRYGRSHTSFATVVRA